MSDLNRTMRSFTDRAIDAAEILEDGLRHLQMEVPSTPVSWVDNNGDTRHMTLSDYVEHIIREAKRKCRK